MLISPFLLSQEDILSQSLTVPKDFQPGAKKEECLHGHPPGGSLLIFAEGCTEIVSLFAYL